MNTPTRTPEKEEEEMPPLNVHKVKETGALNWIQRHEEEGGVLAISQMFNCKSPQYKICLQIPDLIVIAPFGKNIRKTGGPL